MAAHLDRIDWFATPTDAVRDWDRARPLVALLSAPPAKVHQGAAHRWARWSILAEPERMVRLAPGPDVLDRMLEHVQATARSEPDPAPFPFTGGWVVALAYEVGRSIEPTTAVRAGSLAVDWPWSIVMWRCPGALLHDHAMRRWWSVGAHRLPVACMSTGSAPDAGIIGASRLERPRGAYIDAVGRVLEYIRAGDVFEVNLCHRLIATCSGSARAMFLDLFARAAPWYGAYLEVPDAQGVRAAMSMSPELFLEYDARTRRITTRPIKGTRSGLGDPADLAGSAKDRAELNMIVDLMRNDLGRVSSFGSVRVVEDFTIERHAAFSGDSASEPSGGVLHGVATVAGTLRDGAGLGELLRAAFPAGSISGAPKVRAMQIIEELEPRSRGLYTGAIGYISDGGGMAMNVAIRTALVRGGPAPSNSPLDRVVDGRLVYSVGAGIVADSNPETEFEETIDKAGLLPGPRPGSHGLEWRQIEVPA